MPMNFSLRQQQAIEWDDNKELLVSAAAGSGKTTVLTARIIDRIVNGRIGIDRFLIVTYTRKSADELREKITKLLNAQLNETPDDSFLSLQIANMSSASIGTMHSFCLNVLKEYHEHPAVMLPKNLKILSEGKVSELLDEATDEVFTDLYSEHDAAFELLLNTFASFQSDEEVKNQVKSVYKFSLNNESPYEWLKKMRDDENAYEYERAVYGFYKVILQNAINLCEYATENYIPSAKSKYDFSDDLKQVITILNKTVNCMDNNDYYGAKTAMLELSFINLKGNYKDEGIIAQKRVLAFIKNTVCKTVNFDAQIDCGIQMKCVVSTLFDIAIRVGKRFEQKKRKLKSVDYNDMEHLVLNLFEDKSVAQVYSSKFKHIMFDEYQDCNSLQEKIVQKISSNAKCFMVGDIKQSIYGFRQAEPKLFLEKYKSYKYDKNSPYALIELNENYRSRENVLNAVNRVFFKIMREDFCGMDYNAQNALNAKACYLQESECDTFENSPVKLSLISCNMKNKADKCNSQLLYIIDSIRDMMKNKCVFDSSENRYRPLKYSDIAILLRSPQSSNSFIREAFSHTEIPINIDQDADIRYEPEVNLLISLLKCIENPYNDIELMTVLHSYIFEVTDSELAELVSGEDIDLIDKVQNYADNGENDTLKLKLRYFIKKYAEWTENVLYIPIDDFIDSLLHDVMYYEYFTAQDNGLKKRENIEQLVSLLVKDLQDMGVGLYECMRIIKNIDENGLSVSNNAKLSDHVSVMSIHKSKGLEFPVVFVMNISGKYSDNDIRKTLLIHKDYGAVSQYVDTEHRLKYISKEYELMSNIIKKNQQEEEQRVLYVAMTRAKEHLELVGNISESDKSAYLFENIAYIANAKSYIELICYALCADDKYNTTYTGIKDLFGKTLRFYADGVELYPSIWNIELFNFAEGTLSGKNRTISYSELNAVTNDNIAIGQTGQSNESFFDYEELIRKMTYEYPYKEQTKINSKLSVTQIKNLLENSTEEYIPDYRTENVPHITVDGTLSATRIGSLYHFFMQHASIVYPYTKQNFDSDIKRMLDKKLITFKESRFIKSDRILPFFNLEIGKRLINSEYCTREKNFSYLIDASSVYGDNIGDGKILMQGVVDCFFKDNTGKYVLIDYKTDAVAQGEEDILVFRHKKQIALYKEAIENIENVKIDECYIFSFVLGKFIAI